MMSHKNHNMRLEDLIERHLKFQYAQSYNPIEGNPSGKHNKNFLKQQDREYNRKHKHDPDFKPHSSTRGLIFGQKSLEGLLDGGGLFAKWALREYPDKTRYENLKQFSELHPDAAPKFLNWLKNDAVNPRNGGHYSACYYQQVRNAVIHVLDIPPELTCRGAHFLPESPVRHFGDFHQNRGPTKSSAHFSEAKNPDVVECAKCTGLRRVEMEHLRGKQLQYDEKNGNPYFDVIGKGGKRRRAYIRGKPDEVQRVIERSRRNGPDGLVFGRINKNAQIHRYRSYFATKVYLERRRPLDQIPPKEKYYQHLRKADGTEIVRIWDRKALDYVARLIGHGENRPDVAVNDYMYGGGELTDAGYPDDGKEYEPARMAQN